MWYKTNYCSVICCLPVITMTSVGSPIGSLVCVRWGIWVNSFTSTTVNQILSLALKSWNQQSYSTSVHTMQHEHCRWIDKRTEQSQKTTYTEHQLPITWFVLCFFSPFFLDFNTFFPFSFKLCIEYFTILLVVIVGCYTLYFL